MISPLRIGIDFGGTKIESIALDSHGNELERYRIPTPRGDYDASVQAVVDLVKRHESKLQERASVGIGIPGTVSPITGLVKNANSTWIIGRPFPIDLGKALNREVRCANDANCLAVSEATDGAAAGAHVVFAGILGTGCGAGISVAGRVHDGPNGVAGEWGHNPLPWMTQTELPGPPCYCGRSGCIETWISGTGFEKDYERTTGHKKKSTEIIELATAGDPASLAALGRFEDRLARSLAHVINVLDPDVIVLGGGMSRVTRLYRTVPLILPEYVFGKECTTRIHPAKHGDSSGVRGAAWLWPL